MGQGSSESSFYWAMRRLPARQRQAMFAIYAFCREVDDIADGSAPAADKLSRLDDYTRAVEDLFAGRDADVATVAALNPVVAQYGLDRADLLAVIHGMEMDAAGAVRLADWDAFDLYVDRVACAVGRLSDMVFGLRGEAAGRLAHHLGRALQITNILRDLAEDAARDRLYLPRALLAAHGIADGVPGDVLRHPNLGAALDELAARAEADFTAAAHLIAGFEKTQTRPARMMMAVYRRLLDRLRARGLTRVDVPVRLGRWTKLWLALRHGAW